MPGTPRDDPGTPYFLGCPVWAFKGWAGRLFTKKVRPDAYLGEYASVFNTVEGNSSFYSLPSPDTVSRWAKVVPDGFRFAFKFPRVISHELRLIRAEDATRAFFEAIEPLAGRLGPTFLQLPPRFDVRDLKYLERYLDRVLDLTLEYAVEVRHPDFFERGPIERALEDVLASRGVNRVLLDSRPLFAQRSPDSDTRAVQRRKPRVPHRKSVTGASPFVRFIGSNDIEGCRPWLAEWAETVAHWIEDGLQPYVFIHTPNELYAPGMARAFHEELVRRRPQVGAMSPWPGENEATQLALF